MALVIGNTGYWTAGGVTYSGTVRATPTVHNDGSPNQDGGEGFYAFTGSTVSPATGSLVPLAIKVRAAEVRASA